jgi:hypothetical protein
LEGPGVQQLAWLPDGSRLAIAGDGADRGISIVPRLGGEPRMLRVTAPFLSVSRDGSELLLAAFSERGFRIVSIEGEVRAQSKLPLQAIYQVEWAGAERVAALGVDAEREWGVWTTSRSGQDAQRIYVSSDELLGMCVSASGRAPRGAADGTLGVRNGILDRQQLQRLG